MPLYDQYLETMACLMNDQTHLQEKEQMLFDFAMGLFSAACSPRTAEKDEVEKIGELKALLTTDLHRDFTIHSLAGEMKINPYTLIRSFKAVTGITPHAFRMNCRIEHARTLLRQGRDIAETALECGFFDQSHFHRYFKAMTAITPQQYRVNFVQ